MKIKSIFLLLLSLVAAPDVSLAFRIHASTDTIRLSCGVGQQATFDLYVTDGRDSSNQPHTPLTYAHAWFSGTGDFRFVSDSLLNFWGSGQLMIAYSPSSSTLSNEILNIQSDSNTVHVVLIGIPPDHQKLWFGGNQDFDSLITGTETCHDLELYNPNEFDITVTNLWVASKGTYDRLSNIPSLPFTLAAKRKIEFQACMTGSDIPDTSLLGGVLHASFAHGAIADTAIYPIYGKLLFIDSTCLTFSFSSGNEAPEGSTVSVPIRAINPTNGMISIDSMTIDSGNVAQFQIDRPQFPILVYPNSQAIVHYSFTAPNNVPDRSYYSAFATLYLTGKSKAQTVCPSVPVMIDGIAIVPISDTIVLDAPPGGDNTVTITTDQKLSRHAIIIRNDTSVTIAPTTLTIKSPIPQAYFYTIYYETQTYFDTILPGDVSAPPQQLTFDDQDTGTFDIDMTLDYEYKGISHKEEITAQPSYDYHVVLHRVPVGTAGISHGSTDQGDISLIPNPAHDNVTVSLPGRNPSTVEIYDVLGNLMLRKQAEGRFEWNCTSETGERVPNAVYIVRVVTGSESFSRRLVLLH